MPALQGAGIITPFRGRQAIPMRRDCANLYSHSESKQYEFWRGQF